MTKQISGPQHGTPTRAPGPGASDLPPRDDERLPTPAFISKLDLVTESGQPPVVSPSRRFPSAWKRYLVACEAVVAGGFLQLLTFRLGELNRYMLLSVAVLVSAWYGGQGPALFATAASTAGIMLLFYDSPKVLFASPQEMLLLGVFVGAGLLSALIGRSLDRSRRLAFAERDRADRSTRQMDDLVNLLSTNVVPSLFAVRQSLQRLEVATKQLPEGRSVMQSAELVERTQRVLDSAVEQATSGGQRPLPGDGQR